MNTSTNYSGDNTVMTHASWMEKLSNATSMYKRSSSISSAKDPNEKGTVVAGDMSDKDKAGMGVLPGAGSNDTVDYSQFSWFSTNPRGTGEGATEHLRDGNAIDERAKTPTTPLEKISSMQAELQAMAAQFAAPQVGYVPSSVYGNNDLATKMASAQPMTKQAADSAHYALISNFTTDFEKAAYVEGVEHARRLMKTASAGAPPSIGMDGADGLAPEEVEAILMELVNSGQVPQEAVQAMLAQADQNQDGIIAAQEIAAAVEQLVQAGQIAPEQAEAAAAHLVEAYGLGGGEGAPQDPAMAQEGAPGMDPAAQGGAPPAGPPMDPAAAQGVAKAANVINSIFS